MQWSAPRADGTFIEKRSLWILISCSLCLSSSSSSSSIGSSSRWSEIAVCSTKTDMKTGNKTRQWTLRQEFLMLVTHWSRNQWNFIPILDSIKCIEWVCQGNLQPNDFIVTGIMARDFMQSEINTIPHERKVLTAPKKQSLHFELLSFKFIKTAHVLH